VTSATTHSTATKSATVLVMRHLFRIPSEIKAAPIRIKALGSVRLNRVSPRRSMLAATGVTSATTHSTAIDKSTAVLVMRHLPRCFDGSINGEKTKRILSTAHANEVTDVGRDDYRRTANIWRASDRRLQGKGAILPRT